MKRYVIFLSLILSAAISYQVMARPQLMHERVIWTENPSSEAVVSWTTRSSTDNNHIVLQQLDGAGQPQGANRTISSFADGKFKGSGWLWGKRYYHHVDLTELRPNTWYAFTAHSDGHATPTWRFRTAPQTGSVDLVFGGDSRSDEENRQRVNRVMAQRLCSNPEISGLVFGGDFVKSGGRYSDWQEWLDDYALTRCEDRLLPIVPVRGNHERDDTLYNQVWATPGGGGNYFVSDFGNLAIINLNTNISTYGDQRRWLQQQLNQLRSSHGFIFANYHRPAYPAVKTPGSARQAWVPLFEQAEVDLVFESDGHAYKKTYPIYQETIDHERGIVYVGEGGLGVKLRHPNSEHWYLEETARRYHFQWVTVTGNGYSYRAVDDSNQVFGAFEKEVRSSRRRLLHSH